jgi:serpin B
MGTSTHKHIIVLVLLVSTLGLTLTSCAQGQAQAQIAQSKAQRVTSPGAGPADLGELVAGNSAFAFDLYQALRGRDGNLFYSPYSVSVALAMTYAGAQGQTEQQMAATLHYTLSQDRLHPAFNALDLSLVGAKQDEFKLHIANSLWGQTGYAFLAEFLDTLAQNYGAGLRLLDFQKEPEPSRQTINDWVSEQTEEKIKDLIPQGAITPDTRLVLANAIYFDADWQHPFAQERTRDGTFTTLVGEQVTVPMMAMPEPPALPYARGQGYQAVELPYQGERMSMLVLVPDAGQFEAFEAALDAGRVESTLSELELKQVALTMPKFSYESDFDLSATLIGMGMPDAFGSAADFAGMSGARDLYISDVFHKAFVAVDEAGTKAAAATAVVMQEMAMPMIDVELVIDRPFIFIIRDIKTGAILFVGRVLDPKG